MQLEFLVGVDPPEAVPRKMTFIPVNTVSSVFEERRSHLSAAYFLLERLLPFISCRMKKEGKRIQNELVYERVSLE